VTEDTFLNFCSLSTPVLAGAVFRTTCKDPKTRNKKSTCPFLAAMTEILLYVFIGILVLSLLIYFFQERFIFRPEKLKQDFEFKYDAPFREVNFDIEPGVRINGLHFYRPQTKGLILYFHGNTRSIKGWAKYAQDFYRYNYDVVLVDYRGFGKSTGKRTEREMMNDMQFVYNELKNQYGENHLIIYGRKPRQWLCFKAGFR
jgi:predicted alpha/beta-fold hydrolase